jgi:hypothetical protein
MADDFINAIKSNQEAVKCIQFWKLSVTLWFNMSAELNHTLNKQGELVSATVWQIDFDIAIQCRMNNTYIYFLN